MEARHRLGRELISQRTPMTISTDLQVRDDVSTDQWDAFLSSSREGLVFHRSAWLDVLEDQQGASLQRYGLWRGGEGGSESRELVGVVPMFFGRFGPLGVAGSPLILADTPYMGPAIPRERMVEASLAIRGTIRSRASFFRMRLPYALPSSDQKTLESAGFEIITRKTHVLDLSVGPSRLWDQLKGTCRTAVRKARKSGVKIVRITDPHADIVERYYRLVEDVYARQGMAPPHPLEFYERLWQRVAPLGLLSFTIARMNGRDVAGALFAHDEDRMYYLDGASDRDYQRASPNNLVLWSAVEWAAETGRESFDFVGSDIPRLARFKASFGGELVELSGIEWARTKLLSRLRKWYGLHGAALISRMKHRFSSLLSKDDQKSSDD